MPTLADLESKYFPGTRGVVPYSQDTEVFAHIDGVAYFTALATAINATTGSGDVIYIVGWTLDEDMKLLDPAPPSIKELLAQKVDAGVDVRIVIWAGQNQLPGSAVEFGDLGYWADFAPDFLSFKETVEANMLAALNLRVYAPPGAGRPFEFNALMDWAGSSTGSRHQKYAVVYNKSLQEVRAFVGIDISPGRLTTPDHPDVVHSWHDAGVELRGGAATAVWADFRTRWNEVLSLPALQYRWPTGGKRLFNPTLVPPTPGPGAAVITPVAPTTNSVRVVRSYGAKKDTWSDIPWDAVSLAGGLQEILAVYEKAINAATSYIYVEDQGLNNGSLVTPHRLLYPLIGNAARRGVKVLFVCPGNGADFAYSPSLAGELGLALPAPNFRMCRVKDVYVHSKVVLIDDEFAAVGSANFWDRSMNGDDTELTAAIVDTGSFVRDLRVRLMAEHFRVNANDVTYRTVLENVDTAFGLFGMGAYPGGFARPNSRLYDVREVIPSVRI